MTRTLEWIKIKNVLARWYAHDLGASLKYVMNSCYISIVEETQKHVGCKQDVLRYKTLWLLIMPTAWRREHKRPIHTSHTCATYLYMQTCWSIIWHARLLEQTTENYYIQMWRFPLKQYRTSIHTLHCVIFFGERYILAKIPKLPQSSLNACNHLAARCQQM